ncbi:NAD(P)H-dependent flavin oxidoreductase [Falsiroseomonas oryziterrae]|uniref:NAD(P)H-dependent flavin oxidoreductase n=1 Tax=Falsiroseomonas oryziterrae TaxID=2911368 RepID=UPI001F3BB4C2|nr:nitronate monooxygenase [Roseomonas sp. NPKOSM-4]
MGAGTPLARARDFCARFGLRLPVVMGPMASVSPPTLAAAVANAGGMGGCGALMLDARAIAAWMAAFRAASNGAVQINTWIPDPDPPRDAAAEARMAALLAAHGAAMGDLDARPPDFAAQCDAILAAAPQVASSIMGLWPAPFVAELKRRGIAWFANVTSVEEARAAEDAGADAVVVSGLEAGGHRGAFDAAAAGRQAGTTLVLVPLVADAVRIPVIAAGGIADGRALAAVLALGASAAQVGTALLRTPEASLHPAWADAIARSAPEDTVQTRAFSGRLARAIRSRWTEAVGEDALPYPLQRAATAPLRDAAMRAGDAGHMQMWAGQAARLARAEPAGDVVARMWRDAQSLLA